MLCRAAAVKSLPVHHNASYILFPTGSLTQSWLFENRILLKPALGAYAAVANYSVAHEGAQSNRVSDFPDFVCSSFQWQSFLTFYSTVAGFVPCGGLKTSPRISS